MIIPPFDDAVAVEEETSDLEALPCFACCSYWSNSSRNYSISLTFFSKSSSILFGLLESSDSRLFPPVVAAFPFFSSSSSEII